LVFSRAKIYATRSWPEEDLAQHGFLGLLKAIRTYDSTVGSFITWAGTCVDSAIKDGRRQIRSLIHVPHTAKVERPQVEQWPDKLERVARQDEAAFIHEQRDAVMSHLPEASPRARRAIVMRFVEDQSVENVGKELGVSISAVSFLCTRAINHERRRHGLEPVKFKGRLAPDRKQTTA
jgi:RNA polymerase sigma factor (sigma-70 family)